eukprot:COSAG03_NODE_89_length_13462_cov_21.049764_9_plen_135_part_00
MELRTGEAGRTSSGHVTDYVLPPSVCVCLFVPMCNIIIIWLHACGGVQVLQYGVDFLDQWDQVVPTSGRNGAFITTCICHGCNWTAFVQQGKNSYAHYADWTHGVTRGNASLHVDMRPPNGGGAIADPHCASFP